METADIVIGGGGIIGLTIALELSRSGFRVRVMERGRPMAEASWAAAGMLAWEDPENPPDITRFAALSRDLYPEYLQTVERLSARLVPLRTRNTLQATRPGGSFHCGATRTRSPITAEEAEQRIAGLNPGERSFLWLEESSLDPRDLCAALPLAATSAGVVIEEKTEVLAVEARPDSVTVNTSSGRVSAGAFVNCCGAWAGAINDSIQTPGGSQNLQSPPLVVPRKGQMIKVVLEEPAQLQHVLRTPEIYLVPRGEGRIVIGATLEKVGFDRQVEPAAVESLLAWAAHVWPAAGRARIVESWAGFRPGTWDDLPLIGRANAANCWLATGHFRNGILLAPATGLLMRELLEGKTPQVPLDTFAAERWAGC